MTWTAVRRSDLGCRGDLERFQLMAQLDVAASLRTLLYQPLVSGTHNEISDRFHSLGSRSSNPDANASPSAAQHRPHPDNEGFG